MREYDPVPMFCRRVSEPAMPDDGGSRESLRAWLATRLREDLADPVRVDARRRDRITVMRGIEVRINRRTRSIVTHGRNGLAANDWLQGGLKLDRHLSGPYWARSWWWAVRGDAPAALRALGDGMLDVELPDWINRAARRSGLLRSARRKVMAALRLNPRLLAWARALCRNGAVNSNHYEKVWRLPRASKIRMREAPRLWPLYDVLGLSPESDFDVVKRRLREEGLTRGGWKVLCRHGRALWWPARHCHEFGIAPRREVAFLANLVAATGCEELPPTGLLLAVGRLASVHRLNAAESGRLLLPFRAAWRHLATIEEHARAAYLRGPVDAMLTEWMLRPLAPRVPHGVGWAWFDRWLDGVRHALYGRRVPWPTFGRRRRIDGVEVVPLRTLRAVRETGLALRNCMGRVDENDVDVERALFLMRDAQGRALAMFSASVSVGAAGLLEIRGRYNRAADSRLHAIARRYLDASRWCKLTNARRREPEFRCGTRFLEQPPE